jgi:hypothetical protein
VHRGGGRARGGHRRGWVVVNVKGFFVAALSSALDLNIATPDDVLRHVTPDVLANHLPRPLWARLLTACVGAPRVDSQLVVETIGVPNLCEHVPSSIIWACIAEIAQRSLGGVFPEPMAAVPRPIAPTASRPIPLATPPPPDVIPTAVSTTSASGRTPLPSALSSSIPAPTGAPSTTDSLADVVAALENDDRGASGSPQRSRTPTGQRFRQSNTGIGRLANNTVRRPQASATPTIAEPVVAPARDGRGIRRGQTEADEFVVETDVKDDWKNTLAVEDEQLVEWQPSDETQTTDEHSGRKR